MLKKPTTVLLPVAALALAACASTREPTRTGSTVTTVPTPTGQQIVTVEPAGASARGEVRHSVTGTVQGIDRNAGEVTVKATDGSKMTLKVPPLAAANMREGDDVSVTVLVRPR